MSQDVPRLKAVHWDRPQSLPSSSGPLRHLQYVSIKINLPESSPVVSLRKIHEDCCYEPQSQSKKGGEQFTEEDFNNEIARCVTRVVLVKKSESVGDRVVRFLGQFLRHASEKGKMIEQEIGP